jgi:biopolymer transport protein ExbD
MKIRRCKLEPGVPAVAMADIAFNLVLFFIILAKTQDDSAEVEAQKKLKWEAAHVAAVQDLPKTLITVTVTQENKVFLNAREIPRKELTEKDLSEEIAKLLGDKPAGKRTVQLKIHKDAPADIFEKVIEAVSQAGGEVVHVLAEDKN